MERTPFLINREILYIINGKSFGKEYETMKKTVLLCAAFILLLGLWGCGGKKGAEDGQEASPYEDPLEVLKTVVASYKAEELFAMYGGNQEQAVMDAPGKFDLTKADEMEMNLGMPKDQLSNVEDAASMVHMMNANTFTGACYQLKEGTDVEGLAEAVASHIKGTQWLCGQPDTLIMIQVGKSYLITAFGNAELIELFKNNALSALEGAKAIQEESIIRIPSTNSDVLWAAGNRRLLWELL